jgi:lysophospholipase L1-like esterase
MQVSSRRIVHVLAVVLAMFLLAGCLPDKPSAGRGTPVRRVLVLGDSISHGLFGSTARVHEPLQQRLSQRKIAVRVAGNAAETPIDIWPGNPSWPNLMRWWVEAENPDMVIIQSMLFNDSANLARQAQYRTAMRQILDEAQRRGAHVYLVRHPVPAPRAEARNLAVAERLQAEAAAGRGISTIPLDTWINSCDRPFHTDGWHLGPNGQRCHADALVAAVDQLRDANR